MTPKRMVYSNLATHVVRGPLIGVGDESIKEHGFPELPPMPRAMPGSELYICFILHFRIMLGGVNAGMNGALIYHDVNLSLAIRIALQAAYPALLAHPGPNV